MFDVCLCTPRICLQAIWCKFSIGLFLGSFIQPQKSLTFSKIGFIRVSINSNNDSIWIKLKKEFLQENNDVYIGTYYGSPTKRKAVNCDFFKSLNDEICMFKKKGVTLVQGDLNARTGNLKILLGMINLTQNLELKT